MATVAIQSLKSLSQKQSTAKHLMKMFKSIYNDKTNMIDEEAFRKFAARYPNVVFMVDEITGDEGGAAFFDELIKVVFKNIYINLSAKLKTLVNFKIVVADASITSVEVIKKHFSNSITDSDKIYFTNSTANPESFSVEKFLFRNKWSAISINTNSYPANKLGIEYKLILETKKVREIKEIYSEEIVQSGNKAIATDAVNLIMQGQATQVIIYVQNIERINTIQSMMANEYFCQTNKKLKLNEDYMIINSTLSDRQRKDVAQFKDKVKFILMTSSASRGLSFPNTTQILVDVPKFNIETNIMEILQLIYRGRGNHITDLTKDKHLKFFVNEVIYYESKIDMQATKQKLVSIFTLLILIKSSILTRIDGKCKLAKQNIALVPVGGKGLEGNSDMLIESFSALISTLKKECYKPDCGHLHQIRNKLIKIFSEMTIQTTGEIYNNCQLADIKQMFYQSWDAGKLLNFKPLINPIIVGDLMIFKLDNKVSSLLNFRQDIVGRILKEGSLIKTLFKQAYYDEDTPLALKNQLVSVGRLLDYFVQQSSGYSLTLKEETASDDMYIAMPIVGIFAFDEFRAFTEPKNKRTFKTILRDYVSAHFGVGEVLPISHDYEDVPFILFRSTALKKMRQRIYNDRYMFCSSELNLLNLLLL